MYFGNQRVNERMIIHNEAQFRMVSGTGGLDQQIYRGGLGIDLKPQNNNLLLGYGFIRTMSLDSPTGQIEHSDEHRIFQQFIHRHDVKRVKFQHRKRLEERFFEDDINFRFRYFLGIQFPLSANRMEEAKYYLSAYNEVFLLPSKDAFDRDRLYGAVGFVFSPHLRTELGVMRQMQSESTTHQFQISIFNTLPLHR